MKDINLDKEAEEIIIKIIEKCNKNNTKSIIDLIDELINKDIKHKEIEILSLIPRKLAEKGYDIVDTNPLKIKEYSILFLLYIIFNKNYLSYI